MSEFIQLKITLQHTNPPIWRRIIVHKETTLFELHHILQITMGWTNSHLFEFTAHKYRIGHPWEGVDDEEENKLIDSRTVTLGQIITAKGETIRYMYDFGDSWDHQIVCEDFLPYDYSLKEYPICTGGEGKCPPEDCGSIPGYFNMLEILKDKKHPEYKEMMTWLGGKYNPAEFDKEKVNKTLKTLDRYIKKWLDLNT